MIKLLDDEPLYSKTAGSVDHKIHKNYVLVHWLRAELKTRKVNIRTPFGMKALWVSHTLSIQPTYQDYRENRKSIMYLTVKYTK